VYHPVQTGLQLLSFGEWQNNKWLLRRNERLLTVSAVLHIGFNRFRPVQKTLLMP